MRIVAVADTHLYEADLAPVPDGDVFVHAGDMLRFGTLAELDRFAAWVRGLPHPYKVIVAGNHDRCFEQDRAAAVARLPAGTLYLEDTGVTLLGVTFWGSPWQPAYNDWAFNLPRGAPLRERWALVPEGTDVLVTHGPPAGHGDRSPVVGRAGCVDLADRARVVRPALHLFGHIHQDGGVWHDDGVTYANVTTWEGERRATVIDLDPRSRLVTPVEVPPPGR